MEALKKMVTTNGYHNKMFDTLSNLNNQKQIIEHSKLEIEDMIFSIKNMNLNESEKKFLNLIVEEARSNFYMEFNQDDIAFLLIKRNFKGFIRVAHNKAEVELKDYYNGAEFIIDLLNIHSYEKGEGHKMMKRVLRLSKELKLPICLWTETNENVLYFENYGFKNIGQLGVNGEYRMVLSN